MIEPLAVPAASLLRLSSRTYWSLSESDRGDSAAMARLACEAYLLGDAIVFDQPDDGWDDEELFFAGVYLTTFADALAIEAATWTHERPLYAAPRRELVDEAFRDNGLSNWLDAVLREVTEVVDADEWIARYRNVCRFDDMCVDLDPDDEGVDDYRSRERTEWSHYRATVIQSAQFLQSAIAGYASLYYALCDPDAESFFLLAEEHRVSMLEGLAWGRICSATLNQNGGAVEAIYAVDLGCRLTRHGYLILSTRSAEEFADLRVVTPSEASQLAAVHQLEEWARQVVLQANVS